MIKKAMSFKGNLKKKQYFEGWYYKLVSQNQKYSLSIISGISLNKEDSHAFIQIVFSGMDTKEEFITKYLKFDKSAFDYDYGNSKITVEKNSFSLNELIVNHESDEISIKGTVKLSNLTPIKTSILSPTIMGYFSYFPFMECIHAIVSMDHILDGKITIDGKEIDFTGGKGYIEKDLGKSFPSSYIWMQSNNFENKKASFMLSYATIPFLGFHFNGLISNLVIDGKEYRFATYNYSSIKITEIQDSKIKLVVKKRKYLLDVEVNYDDGHVLKSPKNGKMSQTIRESLMGRIYLKLYKDNILIFEGQGANSGVEVMLK